MARTPCRPLLVDVPVTLETHTAYTNWRYGVLVVVAARVVSSEISGKFPEIYSNLFGYLLLTYENQLFLSPALQSDAVK